MRPRTLATFLLSAFLCALVWPAPGAAREVYVRLGGERLPTDPEHIEIVVSRIQTAVSVTNVGDIITVWPGRYTVENQGLGNLSTHSIVYFERQDNGKVMRSAEGPETTIIDGEGIARAIHVEGEDIYATPVSLRIDGFTFTNGEATATPSGVSGGAVLGHLAGTTFENCIFFNNHAQDDGGAVWWGGQGDILFRDCQFYDNSADRFGGAFLYVNSQLNRGAFRRCLFQDNVARHGGGAMFIWYSQFRIQECVFLDNTVLAVDTGLGGGIYMGAAARDPDTFKPSLVLNSTIVGNSATTGGGIAMRRRGIPISGGEGTELKSCYVDIENTIVAHQRKGGAFYRDADPQDGISIVNTISGGNVGGDWSGNTGHMQSEDGNMRANPRLCDWAAGDLDLCPTSPALPENRLDDELVGYTDLTCERCSAAPTATVAAVAMPSYPNPFDPELGSSNILYNIVRGGKVTLKIYDNAGRYVATVAEGHHDVGDGYLAPWDGRDSSGRRVAAGVYNFRLDVDGEAVNGKISVLK